MRPGHLSRMEPSGERSESCELHDFMAEAFGRGRRGTSPPAGPGFRRPAPLRRCPAWAGRRAPAGLPCMGPRMARVTGARASPRPGTRRRTACLTPCRRRAWGPPSCPGPVRPDGMPAHGCASPWRKEGRRVRGRTISAARSTPHDQRHPMDDVRAALARMGPVRPVLFRRVMIVGCDRDP